jgi:hypothetical protein
LKRFKKLNYAWDFPALLAVFWEAFGRFYFGSIRAMWLAELDCLKIDFGFRSSKRNAQLNTTVCLINIEKLVERNDLSSNPGKNIEVFEELVFV